MRSTLENRESKMAKTRVVDSRGMRSTANG